MKMQMFYIFILIFATTVVVAQDKNNQALLAVIEIKNNTKNHHSFVSGMPDMLITELLKSRSIKLVERTKIETAIQALNIERIGLTKENNIMLGEWLGADQIIVGSFNKIGSQYRLDIRVIAVIDGSIVVAASATKAYSRFMELIPAVATLLRNQLKQPNSSGLAQSHQNDRDLRQTSASMSEALSILKIHCKPKAALFTDRSVPMQRVKVYVNGIFLGISPIINRLNKSFLIIEEKIPPGNNIITLKHGSITRKGKWKKSLEYQPNPFHIHIAPQQTYTLNYKQKFYDKKITYSSKRQ
ncbi:MAG: CsgG/HfaB family protein [Fibrobacterales bacterium]